MKGFVHIFWLLLSLPAFATDFGDLLPVPTEGHQWEVLNAQTNEVSTIDIINMSKGSFTRRTRNQQTEMIGVTNYVVENGVCYIVSKSFKASKSNSKKTYSPPLRCYISKDDMPYSETFEVLKVDYLTGLETTEKKERLYNFLGSETIYTPAGKYKAEKIEIVRGKKSSVIWRNNENKMIQHHMKTKGSDYYHTFQLFKGSSQ